MQVYFPREKDIPKDENIPSVEMLQKRLNSLREIPVTSEDDPEGSKSNEPSPMEVQENIQTALSSQEGSKNSSEDVDVQNGCSFDLNLNGDKSVPESNQNINTPFIKDNTKDGKIPNDTESSEKGHEGNVLSSETSQKDTSLPEKDQEDNSPSSKSPNNILLQHSLHKDDTLPPEETKNDNTPPPEETTDGDIPSLPKDDENVVNTQDTQQSSPLDTTTTDEPLKPPSTAEQSGGEGDNQPPILQKSVSEPASM